MSFHTFNLDNFYRKSIRVKSKKNFFFINDGCDEDDDNDNEDTATYDVKNETYFNFCNIFLLFWIYVLQGIPLGIIANIPNMLKENGASFSQQAKFSLTNWSHILKIFWAPVVDSIYIRSFGRRKTWLVLMQYSIAALLVFISFHIDDWLEGSITDSDINHMTISFFVLKMLDATQDIAADGWALSMHKNEQTAYTDVCDMVGLSIGYSIGHVLFLSLRSADFCNNFLRKEPKERGLVTFPDFLWFWAIFYMIFTTLIAICTKELNEFDQQQTTSKGESEELGVVETYKKAWSIFYVPSVQLLALTLLTARVMYSPYESINQLKLIEMGFSSSQLALMHVPVFVVNILLPVYTSLYVDKKRPIDTYLLFIPIRMFLTVTGAAITFFTPSMMVNGELTILNYATVLFNTSFYKFTMYVMSCTTSIFFSTVCDTNLGGTYLSLLNTLTNIGIIWPNLLFIWLVDKIDIRRWSESNDAILDGYYIETFIATIYGVIWLMVFRKYLLHLQSLPKTKWNVIQKKVHKKIW